MLQLEAFNPLKMGKNVFLTGEAGSGKTYLLNQYIRYLKNYLRHQLIGTARTSREMIIAKMKSGKICIQSFQRML